MTPKRVYPFTPVNGLRDIGPIYLIFFDVEMGKAKSFDVVSGSTHHPPNMPSPGEDTVRVFAL